MNDKPIKILLIEDDPGDADYFREILSEDKNSPFKIEWVDRLKAGQDRLADSPFDIVLSDLSLPDSQGLETFTKVYTQAPETPIIVLSGFDDEQTAINAVKEGAQDYLVKGQLDGDLLKRSIYYAIERKQTERKLKEETNLSRILLDNMLCSALLIRPKTREVVLANEHAIKSGAVPGKQCFATWGKKSAPCPWCLAPEVWTTGKIKRTEVNISGSIWDTYWVPITEDLYLHYAFDITERKRVERELSQYRQHLEELVKERTTELKDALTEVEQLKNKLQAENIYLQDEIKLEHNFEEIISQSKSFNKVLRNIERVATTGSTVLILGETGTGKELVSRAVHNLSKRRNRPLVKVNCAAIPVNLIESELFGHEKGAFTGAFAKRIGRFELANGGTVFLDEIGDLPLELQAKLLRVIQEGEFERIGSTKTIKIDVRIIAATNRDLEKAIVAGEFRHDLYYRLNVFPIMIPPLRERKDDIPLLVNHFVKKYSVKLGKKIESIPQNVMASLQAYQWTGNVRELENIIERAVILTDGPTLELEDFFEVSSAKAKQSDTLKTLKENEQLIIQNVLEQCNWVIEGKLGAASCLGIGASTLRLKIKKYGFKRPHNS